VPTVTVVTDALLSLAKSAAKSYGYPDLPMVVVPHPFETLAPERIRQIAEEKFAEIVSAVSRPTEVPSQR